MVEDKPNQGLRVSGKQEDAAQEKTPLAARQFGYAVAIVVNIILMYVFHSLLRWGVPFLTEDWGEVLPLMDISIGATIVANIVFIIYDARWFRHLVQVGLNLLSLRVVYAMYIIFPFDFDMGMVEQGLRIGLIVAMAGIIIGTIFELIGLLFRRE